MAQTRQKIKTIIRSYKTMLTHLGIRVEKIVLYGSYAYGKPHKDSDIDLIVVSADFKKFNLRQRLEVLGVAAARVMKPIEAKGYTAGELRLIPSGNFLKEALKQGLVF